MDPEVTCTACGARRNCMNHLRSEFPPEAAMKWLLKQCDRDDCFFAYRAGIKVGGPVVGQEAP